MPLIQALVASDVAVDWERNGGPLGRRKLIIQSSLHRASFLSDLQSGNRVQRTTRMSSSWHRDGCCYGMKVCIFDNCGYLLATEHAYRRERNRTVRGTS
jgi:hypothetical protein